MTCTALLCVLLAQPGAGEIDPVDVPPLEALDAGLPAPPPPLDAGTAPLPFPVRFEGNVVLPDEVYLGLLELPADARPDPKTAEQVGLWVQQFLRRTGYELAQVSVILENGGLTLQIDEGKLEKLVFRGRFTVRMLRFKLALDLPKEVFNRPHLEREVRERAQALGVEPPTWALVDTENIEHRGVQLEETTALVVAGRSLIRPKERLELHFTFGEPTWSTGLGVDLRTSWLNGLEAGLNYQGKSLALTDDRWRVALTGGLALRRDLPRRNVYLDPSRVRADALWYSPPLNSDGLARGFLHAYGEWFSRQRRDFGLERFMAVRTEFSGNLSMRLHRLVALQAGVGVQYFWVGGFQPGESLPPFELDTEPWRLRVHGELRGELTFFDGGARWDRRHALALAARLSGNLNRADLPPFLDARFYYQLVIPFGWNDLWIRAKGTWLSGDVLFPFEDVTGQHLPAVFGDVWLRKAVSLRLEYRYSLVRDLLKAGVVAIGLLYGDERRDTGDTTPRIGFGAGPSVHLLVESFFQVDVFLNFAVLSDGRFSPGLQLMLKKVF